MAAASKRFGYARGEKVMKEIRGGLPEKDANNNVMMPGSKAPTIEP